MSHIFISYSRKDLTFAQKIVDALATNNLDTWIDWKSIPKGEDWEKEIYHGIEGAEAFLFLLSPDSVVSEMCNKEIANAIKNGKRILPIFIADVDNKEVYGITGKFLWEETKEEINRRNFIFCREKRDVFNKAIEEIQTTIQTDYEWLKYHTRLQVKALEWERTQDNSRLLRGKELREAEEQLTIAGSEKDPQPTNVQREYFLVSSKDERRRRSRIIAISVIAGIVMVGLGVYAQIQGNLASDRAATAQAASTGQAEQAATAQAASTSAIEQAQIALARQLAAQAQSITGDTKTQILQSSLLAIESLRLYQNTEASQLLRYRLGQLSRPVSSITHDNTISSVAFSPNGKWVVSGSWDGTARVWDAVSGQEISRMTHDDLGVYTVAFSPDSKWVASGGDDSTARVWDATNGQEVAHMSHGDRVLSVAFSPDGKWVVSGSMDGTARVWDAASGQEISRMTHDDLGVNTVAFNSNGRWVASGGGDSTVRIWDAASGQEISRMTHDDLGVNTVAFSPNGRWVASGGNDSTARVWELSSGQEVSQIKHDGYVSSVAFSPDSKWVVSGGGNQTSDLNKLVLSTARVWEATSGQEVARMTHGGYAVSSVAFSPDGKWIVSGGCDVVSNKGECEEGTARVWETASGQEVARMIQDSEVTCVAFSPDGKLVVLGDWRGVASIWEAENPQDVARKTYDYQVMSVAFSPNGRWVASGACEFVDEGDGCTHGKTLVWDIISGEEVARLMHNGQVTSIAFSPDGERIVSGGDDITARVLNLSSGQEMAHMSHGDRVLSVAFSPDSKWVVSGSMDGTARVWDVASGQEISRMTHDDLGVNTVAFNSNGRWVASGGNDSTARVWEAASGQEISRIPHGGGVNSVAFSPDGNWIISGSEDGTARVWEAVNGKEISHIKQDYPVSSVAFSPNGKWVVSGFKDGTARIWEAARGKQISQIKHDSSIFSVAFSPDGKWVVSASMDGTARVWEATSGQEISSMSHGRWVFSASFSPDGKWIASGGCDVSNDWGRCAQGTARVWFWQPKDIIIEACYRLIRNLTMDEWQKYLGFDIPYHATCPNLPIPEE